MVRYLTKIGRPFVLRYRTMNGMLLLDTVVCLEYLAVRLLIDCES